MSIENRVQTIKQDALRRESRAKYVSDTNSVVTDLVDSPWVRWEHGAATDNTVDEELERIRSWTKSLTIDEQEKEEDSSPLSF